MTRREIADRLNWLLINLDGLSLRSEAAGLARDLGKEADATDAEWRSVVESFRLEAEQLKAAHERAIAECDRLRVELDRASRPGPAAVPGPRTIAIPPGYEVTLKPIDTPGAVL